MTRAEGRRGHRRLDRRRRIGQRAGVLIEHDPSLELLRGQILWKYELRLGEDVASRVSMFSCAEKPRAC